MSQSEVEKSNKTLDQTLDECLEECFEKSEENSEKSNSHNSSDNITNDENSIDDNENIIDDNESLDEDENVVELTFEELVLVINDKYMDFLNKLHKIYENHDTLSKSINFDIEYLREKLEEDKESVLKIITDNYLYCLEQVKDKNSDFFIYQKEKIIKKKSSSKGNVKIIKNKISKIGNKTLLKNVLENLKRDTVVDIFNDLMEIFKLLIYEDDENVYNFHEDYLDFVKINFQNNKNYNKICVVIDNIDLLIGSLEEDQIEENEYREKIDLENKEKKEKKKSKKSKDDNNVGEEFIKGIENTKIAKMAKNISEKINLDDFPILTDPSKLLSTLTNPEEGLGSVGGLMDVVMKEVQSSFQEGNGEENDLINEAQNIMGKLNGTNLDPVNLMKNMNLDMDKMADLFKK